MKDKKQLDELLSSLGGKEPSAFRAVEGEYNYGDFELAVDGVTEDLTRNPMRLRVRVSAERAGYPSGSFSTQTREIAGRDFLVRSFAARIPQFSIKSGGTGGRFAIDRLSQEMLETSAAVIGDGLIEIRFTLELPLHNGKISGVGSVDLFIKRLPNLVRKALFFENIEVEDFTRWIENAEDVEHLRGELKAAGLVAFIADGSMPVRNARCTPFKSPDELAVTFDLPNIGEVRGMGIPAGITVVAGGTGHGKSTLLETIALGVYTHVPGDGRELAVTLPDAAAVRIDEGRRIEAVDVSMFLRRMTGGLDPSRYYSEEADTTVSLAANIAEALEIGTSCLILDDDTVPASLMTCDARIQALVPDSCASSNTLADVLPVLRDSYDVSTVIATNGAGDLLDIADTVIVMKDFVPECATAASEKIVQSRPSGRIAGNDAVIKLPKARRPMGQSLESRREKRGEKSRPRGIGYIQYGDEFIDMECVPQLVSPSQARGIARGISLLHRLMNGSRTFGDAVNEVVRRVDTVGLDTLSNRRMGDLSAFRAHELAAAVNRLKSLKVK